VPPPASPAGSTVTLRLEAPARARPVAVIRDERHADTWRVALARRNGAWEADVLLPADPTILRYRFALEGGRLVRERRQVEGVVRPVYGRWRAEDFRIAVYRASAGAEWARDQVIYQIFPDRFARSGLERPRRDVVYGREAIHNDWGALPEAPPKGRDFFGGDLEGIRRRLDHLSDLGVTCLYLTPIFESPTNHRYDALDHRRIDPMLGSEADLRRLVADAKARGIRLILDISINHCSSDSPAFLAAQRDRSAPSFRWFTFTKWPDEYVSWANVRRMPQFTESPEVEDMFFGPQGITRAWLEAGIAGWRQDVVPWKSLRFWQQFGAAMRESQARPSPVRGTEPLYLVSEDWGDSSKWLLGDSFDATMNYRLGYAVRGFALGRIGPSELDDRLETLRRDTPEPAFWSQMNLLTSHDTARLRTIFEEGVRWRDHTKPGPRETRPPDDGVLARLRVAVGIQLAYPGAPMVYYGEEAGLRGTFAEDGRRAYPWDAIDPATYRVFRTAMRARRESVALRRGGLRTAWIRDRDRTYGFIREHPEQTVVVLVNGGSRTARLSVPLHVTRAIRRWRDLLGACRDASFEEGVLSVELPPGTVGWFVQE
jgi:4-alpha-glucanotransferase